MVRFSSDLAALFALHGLLEDDLQFRLLDDVHIGPSDSVAAYPENRAGGAVDLADASVDGYEKQARLERLERL